MRGLSPAVASGGHSSSRCAGLSLSRPVLLRSTSSRRAGSVVVAHGPSRSAACGIFPDQGSNPCPLHWQADSQPLRHQGSPYTLTFKNKNLSPFFWSLIWTISLKSTHSFIKEIFIEYLLGIMHSFRCWEYKDHKKCFLSAGSLLYLLR